MTGCPRLDPEKLLNAEYEIERLPGWFSRDSPVPGFEYNVLNENGSLYEPVLNRRFLQEGGQEPMWPNDHDFAVCLTHDVDSISANSARHDLRKGIKRARLRARTSSSGVEPRVTKGGLLEATKGLVGGAVRAANDLRKRGPDPTHSFERWLEAEAEVGARSTFFVPPEDFHEEHVTDPVYRYSDDVVFEGEQCPFGEVLREIDGRGWEIGLHPTWYAFDSTAELRYQKCQIEDVIEGRVESLRQHWLHYDVRVTPHVHEEAGFRFDSTLGLTGNVGFRFGTAYPWRLYDHVADTRSNVLEVPLVFQDTNLFKDHQLGLEREMAFRYVENLIEAVKSVSGVIVINWHPNFGDRGWKWEFYLDLLDYLDEENAWFPTVSELGEWWIAHEPEAWPDTLF